MIKQNSDILFGFQATLTNPNGDPDQENKPRMDYETNTLLVSDARRKRDVRDFLKKKGYQIFVDTIGETKVTMDTMFLHIKDTYLGSPNKMESLFTRNPQLKKAWKDLFGQTTDYKEAYLEKQKNAKKEKLEAAIEAFDNQFLTEMIQDALIDVRLFGSAMAVKGISKTFTGPVQLSWGYSLHPVELLKSNTIVTIMNDDNSTFGKKPKVYYSLVAHYGTINKYNAQKTGMTLKDREVFRRALVQGLYANQTDSKQGQEPAFYLELVYKPEFDGYLGDLRRFIKADCKENKAIRSIDDITVDFSQLTEAIQKIQEKGYLDKIVGWVHPYLSEEKLLNFPKSLSAYEEVDLWAPIEMEG
ncbi:CRISPR-associated protein [Alkaliphilus crotonatoxidans]